MKLHILGDLDTLTNESVKGVDKSRCIFYGKVDYQALPEFYRKADLQLHLSMFDPCPNVVVEGLSCGLPVVTPMESGAAELIGLENSKWAIEENLSIKYYNLHEVSCVPRVPIHRYVSTVRNVVNDLPAQQFKARERAENVLDIRIIADQYKTFMQDAKRYS